MIRTLTVDYNSSDDNMNDQGDEGDVDSVEELTTFIQDKTGLFDYNDPAHGMSWMSGVRECCVIHVALDLLVSILLLELEIRQW